MESSVPNEAPVTSETLLRMDRQQLDALFAASPAGAIPNGLARGTAIVPTGTRLSGDIAEAVRLFGWQGKTFDAKRGCLVNSVSPLHIAAVSAQVYVAPSWADGRSCIVLDYSKTSIVAHWVRDEIRLVAPNLYLGVAYWWRQRIINFCLDFL